MARHTALLGLESPSNTHTFTAVTGAPLLPCPCSPRSPQPQSFASSSKSMSEAEPTVLSRLQASQDDGRIVVGVIGAGRGEGMLHSQLVKDSAQTLVPASVTVASQCQPDECLEPSQARFHYFAQPWA